MAGSGEAAVLRVAALWSGAGTTRGTGYSSFSHSHNSLFGGGASLPADIQVRELGASFSSPVPRQRHRPPNRPVC